MCVCVCVYIYIYCCEQWSQYSGNNSVDTYITEDDERTLV